MAVTTEKVILKRGKQDTLPTALESGSILIATDTGNSYVDNSDTERVQLKDDTKLPLTGGTLSGDLDMGSNNITTTHIPVNDSDIVNKAYLDDQIDIGTYTAEDPISIDGDNVIKHKEFDSQSGGPDTRETLSFGSSFVVPNIKSDDHGHVTSVSDIQLTLPDAPESIEYSTEAGHAETADSATTAESSATAETAGTADKLTEAKTIDGVSFDGTSNIIHYGVCNEEASVIAKTVEVSNFVLEAGAEVSVLFTNGNSAAGATLNVNETGDKTIYYGGSAFDSVNANYLKEGNVYRFVYDGNFYRVMGYLSLASGTGDYSAVDPIFINEDNVISHKEFDAQSGGPASDQELNYNDTFIVPQVISDEHGHITGVVDRTLKLPDEPVIDGYSADAPILISDDRVISHQESLEDSIQIGPTEDQKISFGDTFTVPSIYANKYGHITYGENKEVTLPSSIDNATTADKLSNEFSIDGIATDGSSDVMHFCECSTESDTEIKVVTCEGFQGRYGSLIYVQFSEDNTADSPRLNVNELGSYRITWKGSPFKDLVSGCVYEFILLNEIWELLSSNSSSSSSGDKIIIEKEDYDALTSYEEDVVYYVYSGG